MSRRPEGAVPDGLLVVDKAEGPTSHDVVQRARRALGLRRIGHTGTLDPMATGVLLLLLGNATRLAPQMTGHRKEYSGEGRLGWATDTYDRTGQAVGPRVDDNLPDATALARAAAALTGTLQQTPPAYSARKVDGVPLYRHARQGRNVAGRAVTVEVSRLQVEMGQEGLFTFTALVSAGTYIRSLIHDLGQNLGCGAHLTALRRRQAGPFSVDQAIPQASLGRASLATPAFVPFHRIPLDLAEIRVDAPAEEHLRQGRAFPAVAAPAAPAIPAAGRLLQVRDAAGHLVALAEPDLEQAGLYRPRRVFAPVAGTLTPPGPDASVSGIPREK